MLDRDRKLRLEHTPPGRLVDDGVQVSEEMLSLIYSNPCIKELPKMASLYGLYSTFIIGHTDIFFACGLSHEMIHQKKIVEGAGWVFPEELLKKTGFWPTGLCCRDFNAFKLHGADTDIRTIIQHMIALELTIYEYKRSGMPVPSFFYLDEDIEHQLIKLQSLKNNKMLVPRVRESAYEDEKKLLQQIAIPEWPITSKSEKPGYLAYLLLSAYATGRTNNRKEKSNYEHQERWDAVFRKNIHDKTGELFNLEQDVADYVFKELDKRHVLYHVIKEREEDVKKRRENQKAYHDLMYRISDGEYDVEMIELAKFTVHINYTGIVNYLIKEYFVSQYAPEEVEYGNYLYFSSTKERQEKEGPDCIGGCYLFYLPSTYEKYFRKKAKERDIRFGSPAGASWIHVDSRGGRWYVVDLPDMPAMELLMHEMNSKMMQVHFTSVFDDAQAESRMFDPGDLAILSSRERIYGKNSDVFSLGVLVNPMIEYTRKRMLVNNDPNPKTPEDLENFRLGIHLPYYQDYDRKPVKKAQPQKWYPAVRGSVVVIGKQDVCEEKEAITGDSDVQAISGAPLVNAKPQDGCTAAAVGLRKDTKTSVSKAGTTQNSPIGASVKLSPHPVADNKPSPTSPDAAAPTAADQVQNRISEEEQQILENVRKLRSMAETKLAYLKANNLPIPDRYNKLLSLDDEHMAVALGLKKAPKGE